MFLCTGRRQKNREVSRPVQGHTVLLTQRVRRPPCSLKLWCCFSPMLVIAEYLSVPPPSPIKWRSKYPHDRWAQIKCHSAERDLSTNGHPLYEQSYADEKTRAQKGQRTCQIPAGQWLPRSEVTFLARPGSFQKLSQQLQPSVRNLFLFTESCALCGSFGLNSLLETKIVFFSSSSEHFKKHFIFIYYCTL